MPNYITRIFFSSLAVSLSLRWNCSAGCAGQQQ